MSKNPKTNKYNNCEQKTIKNPIVEIKDIKEDDIQNEEETRQNVGMIWLPPFNKNTGTHKTRTSELVKWAHAVTGRPAPVRKPDWSARCTGTPGDVTASRHRPL